MPFQSNFGSERSVEIDRRIDNTETVGSDEGNSGFLHESGKFFFSLDSFAADFLETGGDADETFDTFGFCFGNHAGNKFRGNNKNGEVNFTRYGRKGGKDFNAEDFFGFGIYRINLTGILVADKIVEEVLSDLTRFGGGSDHSDGLGLENSVKF
jgi:hypothetical protein